jgi:hypothetical protein
MTPPKLLRVVLALSKLAQADSAHTVTTVAHLTEERIEKAVVNTDIANNGRRKYEKSAAFQTLGQEGAL